MKFPKELTTVTPLSKLLAAILFISLPFIGFVLGIRYQETMDLTKRQQETGSLAIPRAPTPTPIAIPTIDPSITANWKTYTDQKYNYSIKYPHDWQLSFAVPNVGEFSSPDRRLSMDGILLQGIDIVLIIKDASGNEQLAPFNSEGKPLDVTVVKKETVSVDNNPALRYEIIYTDSKQSGSIVMVKRGNRAFQLSTPYAEQDITSARNTFDKILSTFKFFAVGCNTNQHKIER